MRLVRLCDRNEIESIVENGDFSGVGQHCEIDSKKNTHKYKPDIKYLHFFGNDVDILYLSPSRGKYICVYEIPDEILEQSKGKGYYWDFVNFASLFEVEEYAIDTEKLKYEYLKQVFSVENDIDFDYYPYSTEIYKELKCIYDFNKLKDKTNNNNNFGREETDEICNR